MTNLWLATGMGLSWNVWMESGGVSIHAYSHIQLIILKSESMIYIHSIILVETINRVLLATVRNNGNCPCPRCLVKKEDISKLGQVRDMQNRLSRARSYVGDLITRARDFIYKLGLNVAGAAVERLLFEHSWAPTTVRYPPIHWFIAWSIDFVSRMFSPKNWAHWAWIHLKCWLSISCMSLSSEFGKRYSHTLYAFSMQLGLPAALLQSWIEGSSQFL